MSPMTENRDSWDEAVDAATAPPAKSQAPSSVAASGEFEPRRREQARAWMWSLLEEEIHRTFRQDPEVGEALPGIEADVASQGMTPGAAVRALMAIFRESR